MKTQVIISVLATVVISGCSTFPTSTDGTKEDETVAKADAVVTNVVVTQTLSDKNFSYTFGDEHSRSFKRLNSNATLNDLNDFAYAVCWNGYLRPRLQNAQPLSREDAALLDFCINVQLNMVDTLAVAALGDMTDTGCLHNFVVREVESSNSRDKNLEGIYKDQNNVFVDLKAKFIESNEGVRVPMRQWGEGFKSVRQDVMKRLFFDIEKATGTTDVEAASTFDEHPWLWSGSYAAAAYVGGPIGVGVVGIWHATSPDTPNEIEKGAMALNVPAVDMKNRWINARDDVYVYLDEMYNMRRELKSIRASEALQDPQTRKLLQQILSESANDASAVSQYLDYAMYDLPFCVMTYKVNGQLKECLGRWNDDEERMKDVMSEYCQAIAGTEMLKHIRTRYAASGYVAAIEFLKEELDFLWTSNFERFVSESKLYNVVQKVDDEGRSNNELNEIKK